MTKVTRTTWVGTAWFPTRADAYRYYAQHGVLSQDVDMKIFGREIYIGIPGLKEGEEAELRGDNRHGRRWFVKIQFLAGVNDTRVM